jgi:recombination protein RecA
MSNLAKARAALKKNKKIDFKNRVELDPNNTTPVDAISTGSLVIDFLIGGNKLPNGQRQCPGLPRGRMTEIYGPEGSGKTTLALEAAVKCQSEGGSVCFLDYENAIAPAYAQALGVDFSDDKWDLYSPITWEEGAEIIKIMVNAKVDLIIIDSVSAMVPQATFEKDVSETGQIGLLARLQSSFLPNLVHDLRHSGTSLIYLNQLRCRIKTSKYDTGPDEDTSGGRALKYYASLRLKIKRVKTEYSKIENDLTGDSEKQPICNIVRAQCTKNKVSMHQGHSTDFVLRYGEGIDNVRSIMDIAENRNLIQRAGAWYKFVDQQGEEQSLQGKENLRDYLLENTSQFMHLVNQISSFSALGGVTKIGENEDDTSEATGETTSEKVVDPAIEALVDLALEEGLIDQAGPLYKFTDEDGEEQSVRGRDAAIDYLDENPATAVFLENEMDDT